MATQIKITQLTDIGSANLSVTTLLPVVNMAGVPTTQKTTLGNLANVILSQSGGNYAAVGTANIAYSVANAAQPNITSVGTLTNVVVSGNANVGILKVSGTSNLGAVGNVTITGGSNGQVLTTDGSNVLSWTTVSGGGNGTPGGNTTEIQFNDAGAFAGNTGFTFNKTTGILAAPFADVSGVANIVGGGATVATKSLLNVASTFGSNSASDPASAQAIRGRVTGSNLAQTRNYVTGVTGQYLVTGTNASEFIKAGVLGVVGDQTTTADGAVVAYLDGDGGLTTANAAYAVSMKNSTPNSGFNYGLDLQFIDLNLGGVTTSTFKQADIRFNNGVKLVANTAGNISINGNLMTSAEVVASGVIQSGTGLTTGGYLSVDGNTDLHNTVVTGNLSATGNITANNLGNISAINLTGSNSNVLYGNGVFAPIAGGNGTYGNSDVATFLAAYGSNTITTTGNVSVGNISTNGTLTIGNAIISEINPIVLGFTDDIYVGGDVLSQRLKSNTGTVALNASNSTADTEWAFNVNGTLTLPQPVGNTSASIQSIYSNTNSFVDFVSNNSANFTFGTTANNNLVFIAGLSQGNHRWVMGYDGNTTVPGNIKFAGDPSAAPSLNDFFSVTSAANFAIVTDNANTDQTWRFDDTGNLTLPGNVFAVNYANGTQVSIGGGGNTGNVTFDDNIVIGTGDEFGGGGLYLAVGPDSIANGTVQYLRVRGGDAPTHIHLDTGNNQAYDQYFGDDSKYVKLELGEAGNIVVGTDDANGNLYSWSFTSGGNLILADGNSVIQSIANSSLDTLNPNVSTMVLTPDSGYNSQALVLDPTAPGHIHLRAPGANIDEPSANIFLGGEDSSFEVGYYNGAAPNLFIHSNNNTWTFDTNGDLTLPVGGDILVDNGKIISADGEDFIIVVQDSNDDGNRLDLVVTDGTDQATRVEVDIDGMQIHTNLLDVGNSHYWAFNSDGNLNLPGNLVIAGNANVFGTNRALIQPANDLPLIALSSGANGAISSVWVEDIGNVGTSNIAAVYANPTSGSGIVRIVVGQNGSNGGPNLWDFNANGTLTFPGTPRIDTSTNNFEVQAAEAINFEANTVVNIYTDTSNNAFQWQFGDDGNLTLPDTTSVLANVNITLEANDTGNITGLNLIGDSNANLYAHGNVKIVSDSSNTTATWTFGDDGNLTVPGSIINDTSIVLSAPAIFNICTIATAGSGYNTGSSLKATTGGSGTGMTVGIGYGLSNQLTSVSVVNPGTGYVNGDVITVSEGTGGTFVITKYNVLANQTNNNTVQTDLIFANNTLTIPVDGNLVGNLIVPGSIISSGASPAPYISGFSSITLAYGAKIKDTSSDSVSFGQNAGNASQGSQAVAIGLNAGANGQANGAVAVGVGAGQLGQGITGIAIGDSAGSNNQGLGAVAIGAAAGFDSQGQYSVAMGYYAGYTSQANNSIILNATGANLNQTTANTFTVAPVRNDTSNIAEVMFYNTTSKEVTYGNTISVAGNITGGNISATGNVSGTYLISTHASANEGGEISLAQPPNGNLSGGITIDAYQNTLRMFEQGGTARGLSIDIANSPAGGGTAIGYRDIPQVGAGNVTLGATDAGKHYYSTTAGNLTLTIPLNSTVPFTTGTAISIVVQAAGNILVNAASGVTLYMAGNSTAANRVVGGYGMATLMKVATNTWFINGAGVS